MLTVHLSLTACSQAVIMDMLTGRYIGFVELGEGICINEDDEETVATEALIFMLVSLRFHWKYPIGYVFIDKLTADQQKSLVTNAMELSEEHGLHVKAVTCDGTSTNLATMRKMGCKIGKTLDTLDGSFEVKGAHRSSHLALHFFSMLYVLISFFVVVVVISLFLLMYTHVYGNEALNEFFITVRVMFKTFN